MRSIFVTATILAPAVATAGGYVIPNESPRAIGLSQAAVANEHSADAIFLNTAALAGQDGLDIAVGDELLINRTEWSDPGLGSAKIHPQNNTPPTLSIAYGDRLPSGQAWGIGVGFNEPAGGSLFWPSGWQGQEFIQTVKQQVYAIGAGAAFQPLPYLKIGASYLRFQASEELHQGINYLDHVGDAGLAMSGGANGFGVAAQVDVPNLPLSFAVTYSHSADLDLSGHAHFTDVPPAFQSQIHDQSVTEHLKIPNILFVGAAYEVIPNLKIMAAYDFERWSLYKSDDFIGSDGFSVTVQRNYNDAHVIRLAGEWVQLPFLPQLTARAGILRSISDQPKDTLSPSLSDASSWAVSIGAGFNILDTLRIDLGYQHAFFDNVTADPTSMDVLQGTYKTQVDLISLGLDWRTDLAFLKSR